MTRNGGMAAREPHSLAHAVMMMPLAAPSVVVAVGPSPESGRASERAFLEQQVRQFGADSCRTRIKRVRGNRAENTASSSSDGQCQTRRQCAGCFEVVGCARS